MDNSKLDAVISKFCNVVSRKDAEFNEADHPRALDGKFGAGGDHPLMKLAEERNPNKVEGRNPAPTPERMKEMIDNAPNTADAFAKVWEDAGDDGQNKLKAINKLKRQLDNDYSHKPGSIKAIHAVMKNHLEINGISGGKGAAPEDKASRLGRQLSEQTSRR